MASTLSCCFTTLAFLLLFSSPNLASRTLQVPKRPQALDFGFDPPPLVEPIFPAPDNNNYDVTPTLPSSDSVSVSVLPPPPPAPVSNNNNGDNQDLSNFAPAFPFPTFPKLPIPHFPFIPTFPGLPLPPLRKNSDVVASSTMSKGKISP